MRELTVKIASWLSHGDGAVAKESKFVDLAPTDKADKTGVYSEALLYATNNPDISNIALTGPYGSGKSSIIKAFLKRYQRPVLQISLAAFLPEATSTSGEVSKQEIERSILQQMLYGADANKLPLSRFKRIRSPGRWSIFISLYIALGFFSCWHLLQRHDQIIRGEYFLPFSTSNWFNLACFAVGGSFLWLTLHRFYVASFGVSLKSISLKDIEITPAAVTQESILNRHLDEIIYFFQSTKYDLVVIEDLDRFNNPEIFVTLREINSLVNENSGVKRTIRFLYALRDDMFVNTDRTKFFEFIIPVIPIINSSNSIDMMLAQGKRLSLDDRLDRQFLREVSRYLNDLRLIQNIFNEYAIYIANLETDGENVLDANKLLAILIYKNVFPRDFENLHRGKGNLAQILDRHHEFIANGEAGYKAEISHLEQQIAAAERQVPADLKELRRVYAMALIEKLPQSVTVVGLQWNKFIGLSAIPNHAMFDQLIEATTLFCSGPQGHQQSVNIAGLQAEVDPLQTFEQRKDVIEDKSAESRTAAAKKVAELRVKSSALRGAKFNEIIRQNAAGVDDLFEAFGDNAELARFLVFEGYLDDTHYQYTSLFHSGRLSPNDNKFLIQIRGFVNPAPDFQIDNPKEVIAAMRDEDFRQEYVLNVKIVDCLLGDPSAYAIQTTRLFEYFTGSFAKCGAFFATFYATGTQVSVLVSGLIERWAGFVPAAIASSKNVPHVARIIAHVPTRALKALPAKYPAISEFISSNLPAILASGVDFEPVRLKDLDVEIADLAAIEGYPRTARVLFEEGLYQLTIDNIEFIFRAMLGQADPQGLRRQNYTRILDANNLALIARVERDFDLYLQNILLGLGDNTLESVPAILAVIAREELDLDELRAFLERQTATIPSLGQAPTRLKAMLFRLANIEASWDNCLSFLGSEEFDADSLTSYLNMDETVATLSQQPVADDDKASVLRTFLVEADDLRDDVYRRYVAGLPKQRTKFPVGLGAGKLRILIEEHKIVFSEDNLTALSDNSELQLLFVTENIERYLGKQSDFALNDDFREKLLGSPIRDEHKLAIARSMDFTLLASLPARAAIVGPLFDRTQADMSALDAEAARAIIVNSSPISVQISLFNKCEAILSDKDVREILALLPKPLSEINTGYQLPTLPKNEENVELVTWLKARGIISSWRETLFSDEIRIYLFRP